MKIFCFTLGILVLTITSALAEKKAERKPASGFMCTFEYSALDDKWVITVPMNQRNPGTKSTVGTLEQMAQAAYHLSQARICIF